MHYPTGRRNIAASMQKRKLAVHVIITHRREYRKIV